MRAVNLIPAEQRSGGSVGAGRSGGGAYAVLALVAGLALMAFLYGLARHQISDRQGEVAAKQSRAQRLQQQAGALASFTSFVQMRQQRVSAIESLVDSRFDWAHVMHEFGRVLPGGVEISSLTGSVGSLTSSGAAKPASASSGTVASATPPGTVPTFVISGCTATQAKVAEMLTRLRLIDGVTEVTLQSSTKSQSVSGAAAAAAGNGCPANAANFTATVTFQALPATTAAAAASAPHATTISTGGKG